jgi:hypothetical protein
MREILLILIISLILISCKKENGKSDFIGNWSSTSDTNFDINITFSNDSILIENPVVHYDKNYSTKWKVFDKKIKLEETVWDFKLDSRKDTLWIKHETDSVYNLILKRIQNNFEFLENRIGLKLNLPKTSEKLSNVENKELTFNLYLGKKDDSILVRTDNNLNSINEIIFKRSLFKNTEITRNINAKKLERNFKVDTLNVIIFMDKSIRNNELDSIKNIFRKNNVNKFFRIYDNGKYKKPEWKSEINWLGKYEN